MIKNVLSFIYNITFIRILILYFINRGKSLVLKSASISIKAELGNFTTIMNDTFIDSFTKIGKYCYIGKNCNLTKVTIGNYCSIANNVSIGQGEHKLENISTNSIFYEDAYKELTQKNCRIGNDVWIGVDSIILRGVTIGNGAVIGANSVVTKDIPPYAIVVGSPARIIRYRFDKIKIEHIEKSNWWVFPPSEAKKIFTKIESQK